MVSRTVPRRAPGAVSEGAGAEGAGAEGAGAEGAGAPARRTDPAKRMVSKVRLSVRLWKACMTSPPATMTWSPTATVMAVVATHLSTPPESIRR
ncbi:MAG: hypothetical protein EPO40_16860 [Myxococcaceae bacterium]|nr:MAG: hypothetical protein EPO40_16860 [Myxococcaceae bacterium]